MRISLLMFNSKVWNNNAVRQAAAPPFSQGILRFFEYQNNNKKPANRRIKHWNKTTNKLCVTRRWLSQANNVKTGSGFASLIYSNCFAREPQKYP